MLFDVIPAGMEPITIPPFIQTTPTGLILSKDLTFEEWGAIGKNFGRGLQTVAWCIGDWLVYGEDKFERQLPLPGFDAPRGKVSREAYDAAILATGMNFQTLKDIASVCRRFPHEKRVDGLSFDHHRAITTAKPQDRDKWLAIVAPLSPHPSAKRVRLSIRIAENSPRIVSDEEITSRGEQAGHDNYVPHLTRLLTVLRKTVHEMSQDQREALKEDAEQLLELLNNL